MCNAPGVLSGEGVPFFPPHLGQFDAFAGELAEENGFCPGVLEQAVDHVADMHGGLYAVALGELAVEWVGVAIICGGRKATVP